MSRWFWSVGSLAVVVAVFPNRAGCQQPVDWPFYGGDPGAQRWSPLADITPANVPRLAVAWTWHTGETADSFRTGAPTSFEATPIMVEGTLYVSTPLGRVAALDPESGRERWVFDPRVDRRVGYGDFTSRGVSTWLDRAAPAGAACRRRIVEATIDARLIALDAATGQPCSGFGRGGEVSLRRGLRNPPADSAEYEETSPPAVVADVIVVGSAIADNGRVRMASGEVRGFDARTGALRWTWDPVAQDPRDPAYSTWEGAAAHRTGAANAWTVLTADTARGLVFVPTGSASPDYFGGLRVGADRYANSITALRARDGAVVWSFQTVHHDLWDYDNASPATLVTLHRNGRAVPAVLQANKDAQLFVLDRRTGQPLVRVREAPVPSSDVPGERAWPTQPVSALPALSPRTLALDSVWGPTPADRAACRARMAGARNDGPFTPPSLGESVVRPGNIGGAAWGGVAYDSVRGIAVAPVNTIASLVRLYRRNNPARLIAEARDAGKPFIQYTDMRGTPYVMRREFFFGPSGLPCTPPPFGALVGYDLRAGRELWRVPLGDLGQALHARTGHAYPEGLGAPNLGGAMVTASGLVFVAATPDARFRAFDILTGRKLWEATLPAGAKATPMTYRARLGGRQFVVIAAGGDGGLFGRGDALVAYALPPDGS